jgi:hypothetical protein
MTSRVSILALVTASGLLGAPALAVTPNPTPNLRTGDYQAQWGALTVGNPAVYSHVNVSAAEHPTTVHYDATSGTYVVTDGSQNISFSRSEYLSTKSSGAYTAYRDTATGATLKLLNQSATNPVIALTYVTYGKWTPVAQSPIVLNDNYVVFGAMTPAASVPRSGSASYHFILDGTYQMNGSPTGSKTYALSGNGQLSANFGTATTAISFAPVATNTVNGSKIQFGTLTGGGFIDASTSGWNATSRTRAADGSKTLFSATGSFFGPQANEIGAAFTLTQTLGTATVGAGAGALVGKKN